MDEASEAVQKKLGKICSLLYDLGYHISLGVAGEDVPVEINGLIKQAETQMYAEKSRYYQQAGMDRRRR